MKKVGTLLGIILFFAGLLFAQGYRNPPEGSSAMAQAGAFIAQADDPSAVTHNPAGLIQLQGTAFEFGATMVSAKTFYDGAFFSSSTEGTVTLLPSFYFSPDPGSFPIRLGFGITSPYGQGSKWPVETVRAWGFSPPLPFGSGAISTSLPYGAEMETANLAAVAAFQVTDALSIGLGIETYYSKVKISQRVLVDIPSPPFSFETSGILKADDWGIAPVAGMLYRASSWRVGARYRCETSMEYSGDFTIEQMAGVPAGTSMKFPAIAGAGIAFYPIDALKIEFDYEWAGYSSLKSVPVRMQGVTVMDQPRNWKDSATFSLGFEYKPSSEKIWRAGIAHIKSPVPNAFFEPTIADLDRTILSVGNLFHTRHGSCEWSLSMIFYGTRRIASGLPYDGSYSSRGTFLSFGYRW
ncbi:MAG: outer membrane protein transport protein [Candidatus Ratteibacteria bacterium]